jgi:hypothetical protein
MVRLTAGQCQAGVGGSKHQAGRMGGRERTQQRTRQGSHMRPPSHALPPPPT